MLLLHPQFMSKLGVRAGRSTQALTAATLEWSTNLSRVTEPGGCSVVKHLAEMAPNRSIERTSPSQLTLSGRRRSCRTLGPIR